MTTLFFVLLLNAWAPDKGFSTTGDGEIILIKPRGLVRDNANQLHILDSSDCLVKVFASNGEAIRFYGKKGQGPGEFLEPIAIGFKDDVIMVYDQSKGGVHRYKPDGTFLSFVSMSRGYGAFFLNDTIVILKVLEKHLFDHYTLDGKLLKKFGDGFEGELNLSTITSYIVSPVFDEAGDRVYAFYREGGKSLVYSLSTGKLIREDVLTLNRFSGKRSEKFASQGLEVEGGMPIVGGVFCNGKIVKLVNNELEDEQSLLAVFNPNGTNERLVHAPMFSHKIFELNGTIYLFNADELNLKAFSLTF